MLEAADLLEKTNQNGRWQYRDALKILRQTRSKAGVPLLMKYMVKHAGDGSAHILIPEYADTLTLLTGKDIANPYGHGRDRQAAVRDAVQELADKWWTPHQDEITTNLDKMTAEQLEVVAARLLKNAGREHGFDERHGQTEATAYRFYQLMTYHVVHRSSSKSVAWYAEELRPAMVGPLLAQAGFAKEPTAETAQRAGGFPMRRSGCWPICARMAALRTCRRLPTTSVRIRPRG